MFATIFYLTKFCKFNFTRAIFINFFLFMQKTKMVKLTANVIAKKLFAFSHGQLILAGCCYPSIRPQNSWKVTKSFLPKKLVTFMLELKNLPCQIMFCLTFKEPWSDHQVTYTLPLINQPNGLDYIGLVFAASH